MKDDNDTRDVSSNRHLHVPPKGSIRHAVAVDEAKETAGEPPRTLSPVAPAEGELEEELGEEFVENATGVDDAAMQHRDEESEDIGGRLCASSDLDESISNMTASSRPFAH